MDQEEEGSDMSQDEKTENMEEAHAAWNHVAGQLYPVKSKHHFFSTLPSHSLLIYL